MADRCASCSHPIAAHGDTACGVCGCRVLRRVEHLAKLIEIERHGASATIKVDGEPFPWLIGPVADVRVDLDQEMPAVTITLLADRVTVVQDLTPDA